MSSSKHLLKSSRDCNSDCGYCSCDFLSSKTNSLITRVKKYKTNKQRETSAKRRNPSAKELSDCYEELYPHVYPNTVELCESMQHLCMSPAVFRAYNNISEHDQKILNRMAKKRSQKTVLVENAWLAQKMWQNEKYERDLLKCEQREAYRNAVRHKQKIDSHLTQLRFDEISKQDQIRLNKLQKSIHLKNILFEERLEKMKFQQELNLAHRRENEFRKFENIMRTNDEYLLDDELRKQNIYHHLERRLKKANSRRRQYLEMYKKQLKDDNYREHVLHEENYHEALQFENYKKEQLEEMIMKKERKIEKFTERRSRNYSETIERARKSSSLRDLVRRSISPDNFQFNNGRLIHTRPTSNLSSLSSIHLG